MGKDDGKALCFDSFTETFLFLNWKDKLFHVGGISSNTRPCNIIASLKTSVQLIVKKNKKNWDESNAPLNIFFFIIIKSTRI